MQKIKQFYLASIVMSSLFFTVPYAIAAFTNGNTVISTTITTSVTGNSNSTGATALANPAIVPQSGDNSTVHKNSVTIMSSGKVSGDTYGGITRGNGAVYENNVTINAGGEAALAYGGFADAGNGAVYENIVTINAGGKATAVYAGGANGEGHVSGNSAVINGTVDWDVYGGWSHCIGIVSSNVSGNVTDNSVKVTGSAGDVYGGYVFGTGNAASNDVYIDGMVYNNIYGGRTDGNGNAYDNTVIIYTSGSADWVYGGYAYGDGDTTGNSVEVHGSANRIYGGYANGNGDAIGNSVKANGSASLVYGGYAYGDGHVRNNSVEASGTISNAVFYAGRAYGNGDVTGNSIQISGEAAYVYGGSSSGSGIVTDNKVIVAYGGKVHTAVYGGYTIGVGNVTGNSVEISGKAVYAYGGLSQGSGLVTGNKVIVAYGGEVSSDIYGGYSTVSGAVTFNVIEISGTANNVYGGVGNTSITDNEVQISGMANIVVGGYATTGSAPVTNNTIIISGTVNNAVYAGYKSASGLGVISNNTVNIASTAKLTGASLYGSNINGVSGKGNTLNVDGFRGSMNTMGNFEYYNFVLGTLNNQTFIEITGAPVDIDDSHITIDFRPAFLGNIINASDPTIKIISSITATANPVSVTVAPSPFVVYNYIVTYNTAALLLTILNSGVNPQTEAVAEGFVAGLAFLGQAADVRSSIYFAPQGPRFIPFAKMVFGKQYISTGSSVNVKGFSAIAGLALNTNFDNGSQLVVGAFIEGGWGDYDSRNSFRNAASIKGSGDTEYYGGGLLARYALKSGLYGEGTFAVGKTETDFRTYDFTPGTRTKYDYSVPYYSAHLAVGQVLNLTDIFNLDVYGKYLWTRQGGDSVTLDGYRFKFKDADSHRVRVGGKLKADVTPQLQPYAGAAYEYEFSGKIKGSLYGMHMDKPSLRGGTGIGELGLVWTPNDAGNLRVDLGLQGYTGKREGVSGGLTVTMSF